MWVVLQLERVEAVNSREGVDISRVLCRRACIFTLAVSHQRWHSYLAPLLLTDSDIHREGAASRPPPEAEGALRATKG